MSSSTTRIKISHGNSRPHRRHAALPTLDNAKSRTDGGKKASVDDGRTAAAACAAPDHDEECGPELDRSSPAHLPEMDTPSAEGTEPGTARPISSHNKDPVRKVLRPSGVHTMVGMDGIQLTSQLLSDLKRASAVNKAYRLSSFSASEEELLRTLDAARCETTQVHSDEENVLTSEEEFICCSTAPQSDEDYVFTVTVSGSPDDLSSSTHDVAFLDGEVPLPSVAMSRKKCSPTSSSSSGGSRSNSPLEQRVCFVVKPEK